MDLRSNDHHNTDNRHRLIADAMFAAVEHDLVVVAGIGGVHGVLAFLNARTRYRYTGLWPAHGMRGAGAVTPYLYDRESPGLADPDHRVLARVNAHVAQMHEPNRAEHPAEWPNDVAVSVLSTPLVSRAGEVRGRLCHFDTRLRADPPQERAVLEHLGRCSERWLPSA